MIYTHIVYAPLEKKYNIGWCYNNFMEKLEDEDWACFIDHDAMFTTNNWYNQLEDIIIKYPNAGCFTAMTNRIGNSKQIFNFKFKAKSNLNLKKKQREYLNNFHNNHNINEHRKIGSQLQEKYYDDLLSIDMTSPLSGVIILISKKTWNQIKFKDGFFGVDNDIHKKCIEIGKKVFIMKGVYVYHWYRGDENYELVFKLKNYFK